METQFSDDMGTIRADDMEYEMEEDSFLASEERRYKEEKAEFHGELESPEDVASYEAWLDNAVFDCEHSSCLEAMDGNALESVYGPND